VRFWDASAIVPLVCREQLSLRSRSLYRGDSALLVWTLTPTEVFSALSRKRREGVLTQAVVRESRQRLNLLTADWMEVNDLDAVKMRAYRLLEIHPLRAADALQLAAGLVGVLDQPEGFEFVTFDAALGLAAEQEGFSVLGPL
jgi:uncharacterized protein